MIILGIDPGSTLMGYGVIEADGDKLIAHDYGVLKITETNPGAKLVSLSRGLIKLLEQHRPDRVGLEKLYFSKNRKTALEVAQARGVILYELVKRDLPVFEITPNEVKLAVTSYGNSDKLAVAKMVGKILAIDPLPKDDNTTDALAVALAVSQIKTFS